MRYGKCFLSGAFGLVERHHIFGGALRQKSEKFGLVVDLSPWMHREGPKAAHKCWDTRVALCKYGQRKAMIEQGWTVERFVEEFGRNWLEDWEIEEVCGWQADVSAGKGYKEWFREEPWTDEELWGAEAIADADWEADGWTAVDMERERASAGKSVAVTVGGFRVTVEELPF